MTIYRGSRQITEIRQGSDIVYSSYYGSTLIYGYPVGKVLLDTRATGTRTIRLDYTQYYKIYLVGGGGNAGQRRDYGGGAFQTGYGGGGSGAMISGTIKINAGTYSYTIGGAVQDSVFLGQTAGHGNSSVTGYGSASAGESGHATITLSGLVETRVQNSTSGYYNTFWGSGGDTNGYGSASPYNNQRNGPGAGGTSNNSSYQFNGYTGYLRIVAA